MVTAEAVEPWCPVWASRGLELPGNAQVRNYKFAIGLMIVRPCSGNGPDEEDWGLRTGFELVVSQHLNYFWADTTWLCFRTGAIWRVDTVWAGICLCWFMGWNVIRLLRESKQSLVFGEDQNGLVLFGLHRRCECLVSMDLHARLVQTVVILSWSISTRLIWVISQFCYY